jgi:hypothetical protein
VICCNSSGMDILASYGTRIRVQAELKAITKEADGERKLIDQGSPMRMRQGISLWVSDRVQIGLHGKD